MGVHPLDEQTGGAIVTEALHGFNGTPPKVSPFQCLLHCERLDEPPRIRRNMKKFLKNLRCECETFATGSSQLGNFLPDTFVPRGLANLVSD